MKKHYWKVVKVDSFRPGTYRSLMITRGKFSLRYTIGKETKSLLSESGVFVYLTRQQARDSKHIQHGSKILKVKPVGKEISNPIFYDWIDLVNGKLCPSPTRLPYGTTTFPAVIPVEVVR